MKDFLIDFETLGSDPNSIVIDLSVIVFENDVNNIPSFTDLVNSGRRFKFSLRSQKGSRSFTKSTVDWWKEQSQEARDNLNPSPDDLTVEEGTTKFIEYLKENGINQWKSQGWCRGMSFDFPILKDMLQQTYNIQDTYDTEPCRFWNQRDIRTAIECYLDVRGTTKTPLHKDILKGFVHHDSIHDCAKDILMLLYAKAYAMGILEMPSIDDADPETIKGRK